MIAAICILAVFVGANLFVSLAVLLVLFRISRSMFGEDGTSEPNESTDGDDDDPDAIDPPSSVLPVPRGDVFDARCPCESCRRDKLVSRLIRRYAVAGTVGFVRGPIAPAESPLAFCTRWGVS